MAGEYECEASEASVADLQPLKSTIVRLKSYHKGQQDNDSYQAYRTYYKRQYLLILSASSVRLYTTNDGDGREAATSDAAASLREELASLRSAILPDQAPKVHPPLTKSATAPRLRSSASSSGSPASALHRVESGKHSTPSQLLSVSIALSSLVSVRAQPGALLVLTFDPVWATRSTPAAAARLRGLLPRWGGTGAARGAAAPAAAHTLTLTCADGQEAAAVATAVRAAAARLADAVRWLDCGLPLPSAHASVLLVAELDPGSDSQRVVATAPAWGAALAVPAALTAVAEAAGARRGGYDPSRLPRLRIWVATGLGPLTLDITPQQLAAAWAQRARDAGGSEEEACNEGGVPAAAMAICQPLPAGQQEGVAKDARLTLRLLCGVRRVAARPAAPPPSSAPASPESGDDSDDGGGFIAASFHADQEVTLVRPRPPPAAARRVTWLDAAQTRPAPPSKRRSAGMAGAHSQQDQEPTWLGLLPSPATTVVLAVVGHVASSAAGLTQHGGGELPRLLMFVALPLTLVLWRLRQEGTGRAGARPPAWQIWRRRDPARDERPNPCVGGGGAAASVAPAEQPTHTWSLTLQGVEIVEERAMLPAPSVTRTLSWSGVREAAPDLHASLPAGLRALAVSHPGILSEDIAMRFLVGLDSEARAGAAMSAMAAWVQEHGVADIVHRQQPAFAAIKRHYTHGLLGRARDGSVVELECLAQLPAAFPRIMGEGVSQTQLLDHLLFTYEYVFKVLDPAPLPGGKTYKIVDLGALSMGDLRSEGFRFISKAGALLAMNFPQRLHRAFLINAPSWWALAWKLVSPLVTKKVRDRMVIFGRGEKAAMYRALLECIPEDQLPAEYGGTRGGVGLEGSELEVGLQRYVAGLGDVQG